MEKPTTVHQSVIRPMNHPLQLLEHDAAEGNNK